MITLTNSILIQEINEDLVKNISNHAFEATIAKGYDEKFAYEVGCCVAVVIYFKS